MAGEVARSGDLFFDAGGAVEPGLGGEARDDLRTVAATEDGAEEDLAFCVGVAADVTAGPLVHLHGGIAGDHPAFVAGVDRQRLEGGADGEGLVALVVLFRELRKQPDSGFIEGEVEALHSRALASSGAPLCYHASVAAAAAHPG